MGLMDVRTPTSSSQADDDLLVQGAASGDQSAWTVLVERHLSAIVGYAWHVLGDRAEAEDVAQETFLRLLGKIEGWRPGGPGLRTWLYRVAINLCIDRRRLRREMPLEEMLDLPEGADRQPALDDRLDQRHAVRKALDALPERQRMAITLVYYQGMTNREAAELLEVSVEAVESLLARARRALRRQLDPVITDLMGVS